MFDSGITTLNLAISDNPDTFAGPGNIVSYIGASNVGKTVLALTTMAASFYRYGHRPLYYALEPNLMINIERLYGKKFAKALEVVTDLNMTLEQWQADVRARFKGAKKSMVVTLDSTDALKCAADIAALDGKSLSKKSKTDTPEGGEITITISARRWSIHNTGAQIPEDQLRAVWQAYYKADTARSRPEGSGLGLSIVKAIMELHGFACGAENTAEGVRFWFEMPETY